MLYFEKQLFRSTYFCTHFPVLAVEALHQLHVFWIAYAPFFFHTLRSTVVNFSKINLNELRRQFAYDRLLILGGLNPTGDKDVRLFKCCVFSVRRADHSSRRALPSVVLLSVIVKPRQ
jgi:hypothetical protein